MPSNAFVARTLCLILPAVILLNAFYQFAVNPLPHSPFLQLPERPLYAHRPPVFNKYFPPPSAEIKNYRDWNTRALQDLYSCMALDTCGVNQTKVALLADNWFQLAVVKNFRGGEGVWGISIYKHLHQLGYTTLISTDLEETAQLYRMMPDLVKVVIRSDVYKCFEHPDCLKTKSNPTGIPAWKLFELSYWPNNRKNEDKWRMKGKWLLSALPDTEEPSPIQFLGFSIEEECTKMPVIPLYERKNQVWMLMKQLIYVYHWNFAWNRSYFPLAHEELGVDFVGGWKIEKNYLDWGKNIKEEMLDIHDPDHGVYNVGIQKAEAFLQNLRHSKMLIGMTNPHWSPSPLDALCMGVPFLNPIASWDHDDPWNKAHWYTQHPTLEAYDRPYVYHVHKNNYTGFIEAIDTAMKTPIDRYLLDFLTEKAMEARVSNLMETDWFEEGTKQLMENMAKAERGEDAFIFEL